MISLFSKLSHTAKVLGSNRRALTITVLVLAVILAFAGALELFNVRHQRAKAAAQEQLSALADQRMRTINNWREERLADARFFSRARFVARDVQEWLAQPDAEETRNNLVDWLSTLQGEERYYEILILDAQLQRKFALPSNASDLAEEERTSLLEILREGTVRLTDLQRNPVNERIYCDVLFPIFADAAPQNSLLAVGLLRANAKASLFSILQRWPVPSETAETLLVRREGENVLYLNELRHRKDTALQLRHPFNDSKLPAARILRGEKGPFEGVDYRGVPVVAVGHPIPGTSWALIAKIDVKEIYAPMRWLLAVEVAAMVAAGVATALLVAFLWREHRTTLLRRAASEWKLTFDSVPDLIAILDQQNRIVRVNRAMAQRLGSSPTDCMGATCFQCVHGTSGPPPDCPHAQTALDGLPHSAELYEPRLGGTFLLTTTPLLDGGGVVSGAVHVARDITERKRAEEALKASLQEKEVLLREIHHRVKNNLQIISSLASLQADELHPPQVQAALLDMNLRVRSMAMVHERLYQSEDLARIEFSDYARDFLHSLWRGCRKPEQDIELRLDMISLTLPVDIAIPLGLILNELASNALKHAFRDRDRGSVTVCLQQDAEKRIHLGILDDGAGFPADLDMENAQSLGLRLVKMLSRQLNSTVAVRRLESGGTEFDVVFSEQG